MSVTSQIDDQHVAAAVSAAARPLQVRASSKSFVRDNLGLMICAFGFAAGCVFWHYVGFWAVVQYVFYPGGSVDRSAQIQSPSQVQAPATPVSAQSAGSANVGLLSVKLSADSCSSLIMDRSNGSMSIQACAPEVMPLNSLRAARKDDRRATVAEAKAAASASAAMFAVPPVASKPKTAPTAPAVASWSATIVTSPAR
jgi:hypothetical protein